MRFQSDFIRDLVETRKVSDQFAQKLIPLNKQNVQVAFDTHDNYKHTLKEEKPTIFNKLLSTLGINKPMQLKTEAKETEAPSVYSYSLFYVYYDQYTFISGILAQNALLGVGGVVLAI